MANDKVGCIRFMDNCPQYTFCMVDGDGVALLIRCLTCPKQFADNCEIMDKEKELTKRGRTRKKKND